MKGQSGTATDDGCSANSRDKKSGYKMIAFSISALTVAKDNVSTRRLICEGPCHRPALYYHTLARPHLFST